MSNLPEILALLVQQHSPNIDYDFPKSLSPFLKTNDLPPESDVKVLEDLSKNVSDALRLITSDMESLIGAHSQLKKIQDHLLHVDAEIKRAAPPIERVPVEILMQVFREATSTMGNPLDMRWEPFVISRVCHKWRVVATEQCPEIWTKFMFERAVWDDVEDPIALLSLVLSRGAERSLEFNFNASSDSDVSDYRGLEQTLSENSSNEDEEDEDEGYTRVPWYLRIDDSITKPVLQELVHHCLRWRAVYFSIPTRLFHLLSPIRGKLPALVLFSLDCVADDQAVQSSILTQSHILDGAPLLEIVSVSCHEVDFPLLIPQGVPKLTSYTDIGPRYGDPTLRQHFLEIIRTSPHLKSFSIGQMCSPIVPTLRVVHPGITRLSTSDGTFLRSLTLPELKNMELYDSDENTHDEISSLYDLVVHSACNLSSLKVVYCALNENLIHILEASPDLTTLILEFSLCGAAGANSVPTVKSLFDGLGGFKHILVPRLRNLSLTIALGNEDFGIFDHPFGYCIEDRWRKGILHSVTVAIPWIGTEFTLSQDCREQLIRLKDEGMDIEFTSRRKSLLFL
ncbi:hypothetical protein IW261DRAFT_1450858 [Armillaria novae-zelandiae]|uniref:F-box domain-containing protein n=1 Tax=Armillaria novae-zelandiae TaxID=153914 RepID=A0AA39UHN6_9AGAR|nr:hypothetical protein IW261DRAFT_1450858 [Armillaria novae-zelandiae]